MMLLDLVEVLVSHTGVNLANTFSKVLEEFGIKEKVRYHIMEWKKINTHLKTRF